MKKLIALFLAVTMMVTFAGCGNKSESGGEAPKAEIASCEDLLNQVWDTFAEDEKFASYGGDFGTLVDGAAGAFTLEDPEMLTYTLFIPTEEIEKIDGIAKFHNIRKGIDANKYI